MGLFRYWEANNIPLFILAAPMTFVLIKSGIELLSPTPSYSSTAPAEKKSKSPTPISRRFDPLIKGVAAAQVILAILAITNYHTQIITRLSSAYPVWYWWLARSLVDRPQSAVRSGIVVFIIMYASIQGALFAFFLPPA